MKEKRADKSVPETGALLVALGVLTGEEPNVFTTISLVRRALMRAGVPARVASEYTELALRCDSYDELMQVTRETVHVT
jgi:hypothetical protein